MVLPFSAFVLLLDRFHLQVSTYSLKMQKESVSPVVQTEVPAMNLECAQLKSHSFPLAVNPANRLPYSNHRDWECGEVVTPSKKIQVEGAKKRGITFKPSNMVAW